jgi:hypothetical protein
MLVDIPFTTFTGRIKQFNNDFKFPIMKEFFSQSFSGFFSEPIFSKELVKQFVTSAGVMHNFGERPRRFSGGLGLPPNRYFTICDGASFNDHGTLRDEITSYYGGSSGITVQIVDPNIETHFLNQCRTLGMTEDDLSIPFYGFIYQIERRTEKNAFILDSENDYKLKENILITYGVRQFDIEINQVIDLRYPETQKWFLKTFVALELENENRACKETGVCFPPKESIDSFGDLLPIIASIETGGGMVFGQAIGHWLRQNGANALIFPSARSNAFNKVNNGFPIECKGWSLLVYKDSEKVESVNLFGRMITWRDTDHDHIHVKYESQGDMCGSFSIRGAREFNLLKFDIEKRIACGIIDAGPMALLEIIGKQNEIISHRVNEILDIENNKNNIWYEDINYGQFVGWLESYWRE